MWLEANISQQYNNILFKTSMYLYCLYNTPCDLEQYYNIPKCILLGNSILSILNRR